MCACGPAFPDAAGVEPQHLYVATRHASNVAASGVFLVAGPGALEAATLRDHIMRSWTLFLRTFTSRGRARRWSVGVRQDAATAFLPPMVKSSAGHTLYASFPDGVSLVDLRDPVSVSSFIKKLCMCEVVWGVEVKARNIDRRAPVVSSLEAGAPPPRDVPDMTAAVAGRKRRIDASGDNERSMRPALAPATPARRLRSAFPHRVAWSRSPMLTTGASGQGALAPSSGRVSVMPARVMLPAGLSGDPLRVCKNVCDNKSVFLTGAPGSGKTFLLRKIVQVLRAASVTVAVCGTSGVAANMVGGITAHSWAGFIHGHGDISLPLDHVIHEVIPRAAKARMRAAMVLVIDEIGTMSAEFLSRLDEVLRAVRGCSSPFGGVVVVFAGDFLQLSPALGSFAFCSSVWRDVFGNKALELRTTWRHVNDAVLLGLLLRLRVGAHTDGDLALLSSRRSSAPPASAVWLTTHKALAAAKNERELAKLAGPSVTFSAVDIVIAPYISKAQASDLLDDGTDFVGRLSLSVGAVVAVHSNCFSSRGVPAGSRGVVESFFLVGHVKLPIVRFFLTGGGHATIRVLPMTTAVYALDGISRAASRTQIPLVLGWASTIHSAQGWTLPSVAVDLEDAFAPGQVLSALSRTPSLSGIHLVSFDSGKIIVDVVAVAFHDSLVSI